MGLGMAVLITVTEARTFTSGDSNTVWDSKCPVQSPPFSFSGSTEVPS